MAILMMWILPIHEHGTCFYLFVSSLISFFSIVYFSRYRSFPSLVRFTPRYFIFLVAISNGISSWFLFLQFCCWYTGMPLTSEYWIYIQLFCQIHLLGQVVFGGVYTIFHVHYHVIFNQWQFHILLSNLDAFYFFFLSDCCG